jgi:hypothetical protein
VEAGLRYAQAYVYDPGYIKQDQVVDMKGNLYSVADDKLVWASRAKTYNPESLRQLVDEIVDPTVAEMKKEKALDRSSGGER